MTENIYKRWKVDLEAIVNGRHQNLQCYYFASDKGKAFHKAVEDYGNKLVSINNCEEQTHIEHNPSKY